jgi:nicotinate-nucleotide--dimethylbenzimidazole phosphoribosyltransferase
MEKLAAVIEQIKPLDDNAMQLAKRRHDTLTKPLGSLGMLEELAIKVAGITGQHLPLIQNKVIITMAGDHGVVREAVSAYPQQVTAQMVVNFVRGGAGINVISRQIGAKVVIVDMGVAQDLSESVLREQYPQGINVIVDKKIGLGTNNIANEPAMSREDAIKAIETGIEIVENELNRGAEIIGIGDMGIGNTTPSSAIVAVITHSPVAAVTGRGTGINDSMLKHKIQVIERAIEINQPDASDPIDVLAKVGGYELGGLAGVIIGCAARRIPVVIDGFITTASGLIAAGITPAVKDYMIASHCSVEIGHKIALAHLNLTPLLNLNLRLGEGTGAALAIFLIDTACKILTDMATFADAGVAEALDNKRA